MATDWYADGLRFTCTQCGNCCTGPPGYVWFNETELAAMAAYLKMDAGEFQRRFCRQVEGQWTINDHKTPHGYDCIFLRRDEAGKALCSIYPVRPQQCRTWPFWPENLATPRSWQRASEVCPGMKAGNAALTAHGAVAGKGQHYTLTQIRVIRDSHPKADD